MAIGFQCKLYRNTGTYGAPTWVEATRIKDNKLNMPMGEADATTRASAGFKEYLQTLIDAGVDFTLQQAPAGVTDNDFTAIRTAFFARTSIEFLILDGAVGVAGVQGLRVTMGVFNFTRDESLENVVAYEVSLKPTPAANPAAWVNY